MSWEKVKMRRDREETLLLPLIFILWCQDVAHVKLDIQAQLNSEKGKVRMGNEKTSLLALISILWN